MNALIASSTSSDASATEPRGSSTNMARTSLHSRPAAPSTESFRTGSIIAPPPPWSYAAREPRRQAAIAAPQAPESPHQRAPHHREPHHREPHHRRLRRYRVRRYRARRHRARGPQGRAPLPLARQISEPTSRLREPATPPRQTP